MSRDARLDEFDSSDAEMAESDADDEEAVVEEPTGGEAASSEESHPAVEPTTAWTPDGAPCADCGAVVERRWRQDDALVCRECKTWSES